MRIFDTYVQKLKYKVLTELARQTWVGNDAFSVFNDIANQVVKKGEPTMSCCIYKDRARISPVFGSITIASTRSALVASMT